jgi:hypothetical protein
MNLESLRSSWQEWKAIRESVITKEEIEAKSVELGVHIANVQRDYVFGRLLAGLA